MFDWLRNPRHRVRAAMAMFWACLVAWPLTHLLMIVTHPAEASWVFHLLLALSWWAMILTALNIVVTTDVRREQDENGD